jgi:uncharacterized protein YjbI with pentapeptide repeats
MIMANVCSVDSCTFDANYDCKCALHCEKSKYQDDRRSGVLRDFYECLGRYIYDEIDTSQKEQITELYTDVMGSGLPSVGYKMVLKLLGTDGGGSALQPTFSDTVVHFGDISFPDRDPRDTFDFFNLFKLLYGLHFDNSTIHFSSINLPKQKFFFQDCKFSNHWSINSYSILDDVASKTLFQNCVFEGDVSTAPEENSRDVLKIEHHLFNDCGFKKTLLIMRGEIKTNIFNNFEGNEQILNELNISGGEFEGRFILNHAKIKTLKIRDVAFKSKFELKESYIEDADIYNVNFHKLFDAYQTEFSNFKISRSIFYDFTGFEKCKFGVEYASSCQATEFEYVTFLNFANFRKAKFYNGLDFEHTNLKEPLNFLDAYIPPKNTNRETYRIIKHSFDKIGNQIEANKYFSYEMKKYKDELEESGSRSELIIYRFNEVISNFGASYLKPAVLMFVFAFTYYLLVLGYEDNVLYQFNNVTNKNIDWFATQMNLFAKGIPPYGKLLKEGMEFVTLLFHIIFLTCTWHFIIAVKRRTKR